MSKMVSIITPSYNRAYIIDDTARSIFNQTYPHWEWMIVDDGSTDDSWEKLQQYAASDSRVKIYKRDREPKGACVCRNIAVEKCSGDYVMFLDTDDVLASFCLQQRVHAMSENEAVDFIIFPMLLFKNKPDDTKLLWNIDKEVDDLERILTGDPICQGTGTLWKKKSFVNVGMWREDLKLWQDIELHIRSLLHPVVYEKKMKLEPDVFLRISDDSLSRVGFYSTPKMESRAAVYMYACTELILRNKFEQYIDGLRIMGNDVITSAVQSKNEDVLNKLLLFCEKNNIYTSREIQSFRQYQKAMKYRLYKLPYFFNKIKDKATSVALPKANTVSTIQWQSSIKL